jgi:crossover junction endodeoxyribonuclease RuvC
MFYLTAIDPGYTGAIAHLSFDPKTNAVQLLHVLDIPTAKAKVGKTEKSFLLLPEIRDMLLPGGVLTPTQIVIEEVGAAPGQGVTSMFRFGYVAGALAGIASTLGVPVSTIRPQKWRGFVGCKQGDDATRLRALELFPRQSDLFKRKMDHNRADAALIGLAFLSQAFPSV